MPDDVKYIVITPVRNEERHIEATLESMLSQIVKPLEWIIVDDGSSDKTGEIIDRYAKVNDRVKALHRPDRGFRKPGGGVMEAFYEGYSKITMKDWEFLVKLDGDLSFGQDFFQECFERFQREFNLGIGGGTIYLIENNQLKVDSVGDPPFHVRGATKIYRRACWKRISPLAKAPGWDTIDEVKANMYGWTTRTFKNVKLVQHKATGSADGKWGNWFKNGLGCYIIGYHPLFLMARCFKHFFEKPPFVISVALWAGYCSGYFRHIPQVPERDVIRYLRYQQLRRLFLKSSIYSQ